MSSSDPRLDQLQNWLRTELRWPFVRVAPASTDASFRRYFRIWGADGATRIVMDAPPDKEDVGPYLQVSALLERCEVHVPQVEASDARLVLVRLLVARLSCIRRPPTPGDRGWAGFVSCPARAARAGPLSPCSSGCFG